MENQQEVEIKPQLKDLVKDNIVRFSHYRADNFYYDVCLKGYEDGGGIVYDPVYQFPVDIDDIGNATMLNEDKALLYMRWIRKALESGELKKL